MIWKMLGVFFLSMVPVIELRGGVPLAIGWGINEIWAIIICVIGNMLPVPFIYLFSRKVLTYGANKRIVGGFCRWMLAKGERAGQKLVHKAGRTGLFLAMMLFVGIPIPGTGAWTGTMGASFLNMGLKSTVLSVCLGVLIAGIIMTLASLGVVHAFGL